MKYKNKTEVMSASKQLLQHFCEAKALAIPSPPLSEQISLNFQTKRPSIVIVVVEVRNLVAESREIDLQAENRLTTDWLTDWLIKCWFTFVKFVFPRSAEGGRLVSTHLSALKYPVAKYLRIQQQNKY